jgi:hypothetical protein
MSKMFVQCPSCKERHFQGTALKVLDVKEGPQGEDVVTYKCPETKQRVEATVYRQR